MITEAITPTRMWSLFPSSECIVRFYVRREKVSTDFPPCKGGVATPSGTIKKNDAEGHQSWRGRGGQFNIRLVGKWVFIFPGPSSSRVPTGAHIRDSRQIPSLYAPLRDQGM